jgi:hypothetical protein
LNLGSCFGWWSGALSLLLMVIFNFLTGTIYEPSLPKALLNLLLNWFNTTELLLVIPSF